MNIHPVSHHTEHGLERRFEFTQSSEFRMEWPEALIEAGWLIDKPEVEKIRGLRMIASECGFDVALLASAYLNLNESVTFDKVFNRDALGSRDLRGLVLPRRDYFRNQPRIALPDQGVFDRLKAIIFMENNPHNLFPNPDETAYENARDLLEMWGARPDNLIKHLVKLNGVARAVLPSLMSRVYTMENPGLNDRDLALMAQTYANQMATNIITAYISWEWGTMEIANNERGGKRNPDNESRIEFASDME